jgi:hypothetical protein
MKEGELKPLTEEQKEGLKKHDENRTRLIKLVEEDYRKYPHNVRKNKKK